MKTYKREKRRHWLIYGIFMAVLLGYLGLSIFFMERFFPGSRINGVDCGWKTPEETEELLLAQADTTELTLLERGGAKEVVSMADLGGKYQIRHQVELAKRKQNGFLWPAVLMYRYSYSVVLDTVFEQTTFESALRELNCMKEQTAPENARVVFTDTGYQVQKESLGNTLVEERFFRAVEKAFSSMKKELDLDAAGCYLEPERYSDSKEIQKVTDQLDLWLASQITYEIGEEPQVIGVEQLQEWIDLSENTAQLRPEAIRAYIDHLADTYDAESTKRVFYGTLQGRVVLTDKKHKWYIDREKETQALLACIQEGGTICREPYYLVPAGSYMGSEIGDTYVEVDMTAQRLWVYENGQMVIETDVVTGNVKRGNSTPGILAYVYAKQKDRILRGEGYASYVKYWMPFYRGYGLHDANWRASFGGEIYKTNGSHGCVNIPRDIMAQIYDVVEKGTPVVTYY